MNKPLAAYADVTKQSASTGLNVRFHILVFKYQHVYMGDRVSQKSKCFTK